MLADPAGVATAERDGDAQHVHLPGGVEAAPSLPPLHVPVPDAGEDEQAESEMTEGNAMALDLALGTGGERAEHQPEMLDLLVGGLLAPDAGALEADAGERRGLEAQEFDSSLGRAGAGRRPRPRPGRDRGSRRRWARPSAEVQSWSRSLLTRRLAREADGVALAHGLALEAAVVGRARDDHPLHPVEDLLPLLGWAAVEVVGQMPGEAPPLGGGKRADVMAGGGAGEVRQLGGEVALGQAIAPLNAGEHGQALDAARRARALRPSGDGLAVEGLALLHHCLMQMPGRLAMAGYVQGERFGQGGGLLPAEEQRLSAAPRPGEASDRGARRRCWLSPGQRRNWRDDESTQAALRG